jgi:hypothetical protein
MSIVLRFVRSSTDTSKDDTIVIRPIWTTCSHGVELLEYSVVMHAAACGYSNKHPYSYTQRLSAVNLRKYLYSLLALLPSDTKPFENVQLDMPNAPSMCFTQSALYTNAWGILNLLDVALDSWPKVYSRAPPQELPRVEA